MNIVILCGGNGTRLWPLSRKKLPKQFLPLTNKYTMFQNTILRFENTQHIDVNKYIIICNKEHTFLVQEQLEKLNIKNDYLIVTEPIGRDTAPAIGISAMLEMKGDNATEDDVSLVVPCDHIFDDEAFCNTINTSYSKCKEENALITFGIKPTYPETGYGYIQVGENNETISFQEKPDLETATEYIEKGNYLWNAGVFMFKNNILAECYKKHAPSIWNACKQTIENSPVEENHCIHLSNEWFSKCESISIDYAIMEKITQQDTKTKDESNVQAYTFSYTGKWSDIGSFKVLSEECSKDADEHGNVSKGDVIPYNTKNCYLSSEKSTLVTIGVEDLIVVNTRDALLISHKEHTQDVKNALKQMNTSHDDLKIVHAKAFRPWGWYINVEGNDYSGYKIKRIGVYPGKRLSLQSHKHRSEHWVIARGKARVQVNDDFYLLGPNEHVFIPVEALHRMENIGDEMVEFVETQIGGYLGEDDIVRYQDDFGRA